MSPIFFFFFWSSWSVSGRETFKRNGWKWHWNWINTFPSIEYSTHAALSKEFQNCLCQSSRHSAFLFHHQKISNVYRRVNIDPLTQMYLNTLYTHTESVAREREEVWESTFIKKKKNKIAWKDTHSWRGEANSKLRIRNLRLCRVVSWRHSACWCAYPLHRYLPWLMRRRRLLLVVLFLCLVL